MSDRPSNNLCAAPPRRLSGLALVMSAAILLLAVGCSRTSTARTSAPTGGRKAATSTTSTAPPLGVITIPADEATGVTPDTQVSVRADNGRLDTVEVSDPKGQKVSGAAIAGGTGWLSSGALAPNTRYTVSVVASAGDDRRLTSSSTFTTLKPAATASVTVVSPADNGVVGVGMPIVLRFPRNVKNKAAVLQRLDLAMSAPVAGAWRWMGDREVHFRPATYWPAGEKVQLAAHLAGLDLGDNVWSVSDRTLNFTVGDSHISNVDARSHTMTVNVNGKAVKQIAVSTGKDSTPTASGIHIALDKSDHVVMDSSTIGIPVDSPDGYKEDVFWNVRISNSGEYVHAAPWSVGSQGRTNVSHGCVNLSTPDGQWFYAFSIPGDVVNVIGTSKPAQIDDAGMANWNVSFAQWAAGPTARVVPVPVAAPPPAKAHAQMQAG